MRRYFSFILALCLLISSFNLTVFAEETSDAPFSVTSPSGCSITYKGKFGNSSIDAWTAMVPDGTDQIQVHVDDLDTYYNIYSINDPDNVLIIPPNPDEEDWPESTCGAYDATTQTFTVPLSYFTYNGTTLLTFQDFENAEDSLFIYVEVQRDNVNKDGLKKAIDLAETATSTLYYTNDDRWNGKKYSSRGFWQEMLTALSVAKSAYEQNTDDQETIDTYTARLNDAHSNLISRIISILQHYTTQSIQLGVGGRES